MVSHKLHRYLVTFACIVLALLVPLVSSSILPASTSSSGYPWPRTIKQGL